MLYQEVHRGPRTFYEYQLAYGMGAVQPLGRDGSANPSQPFVRVPYAVQLVFLPPSQNRSSSYSSLTGATPVATAQSPGYIAQNVSGFFRFTNYRAIVNDFITLAPPAVLDSGVLASGAFSTAASLNYLRADFVRQALLTKAVDPNQRSADFFISSSIPGSAFASVRSLYADPSGTATWAPVGGVVSSVLGGVYGAELTMGNITWSYSSADASFTVVDFSGNVSLTAAGTTFNVPLTIASNGSNPNYHVTRFTLALVPPPVPLIALSASGLTIPLSDEYPANATLQWSTPNRNAYGVAPSSTNVITLLYVPSTTALSYVSNGETNGVLSALEYVDPADSAPYLTPSTGVAPLLRIARSTLSFHLNGPQVACVDDATRLQRLSAGSYWGAQNVGGQVGFTLDVGAGASYFLSRIDYTLRWVPYAEVSRGFSTQLSDPLTPSLYVGYALAGTAGGIVSLPSSSSLPEANPIANLSGTTQTTLWQLNTFALDQRILSTNSRAVLAANLDYTNVLGAVEVGGPGTEQAHPDVDILHFDPSDFSGSRRALGVSYPRTGPESRSLNLAASTDGEALLNAADDVWFTASTLEANDLSYGQLPHFWPSVTYAAPHVALFAVEARFGWTTPGQYGNATALALSARRSQVRVFSQYQNNKRSADQMWTVSNDTLTNGFSFNGYPTIASYYTMSPAVPATRTPIGNATVVVWVRDQDGNTQTGAHWLDQQIMWSRMIQSPSAANASDFYRASWSPPMAVGPGPRVATLEALSLAIDATFTLMARIDPYSRAPFLHAWKTSGNSVFAAVQISADVATQVKILRDSTDGYFSLAYVTNGDVKFLRGMISDNGAGAPTITLGSLTTFPTSATKKLGVSVLSACTTPYGHVLAWLTKAGLVIAEMEYGTAYFGAATSTPFVDSIAIVDNGVNTPDQVSVTRGYVPSLGVNDLSLARQKGLAVAYVSTNARSNVGANGAFNPVRGPSVLALVQTEDYTEQVYRALLTYTAYSDTRIVNVSFPQYDYPGAIFRVRVQLQNYGAVRSPPMLLRVCLGVACMQAGELGQTVAPPILGTVGGTRESV